MAALCPWCSTPSTLKPGNSKNSSAPSTTGSTSAILADDPDLLMYCHEGTWSQVDRVWQIRVVGDVYTVKDGDTLDTIAATHKTYPAMINIPRD